jgi:protein O-mannosyl-transferase
VRAKIAISVCIVVAILIAYEPIRHNNFIIYDDQNYITANPHITEISPESLTWAFTQSHAANWHPLTWLSHMLDYQLFKLNPLGHHSMNLLLHIINALLVFWLFTKFSDSIWAGAFFAAIFALHPIQTESVAWAAERKTVLSGLFWLLTIAAYFKYTKKQNIKNYIILFFTYCLCILTKPVVVTLPLVLLLLDYWPLNRVEWKKSDLKLVVEKIPLIFLSVFLGIVTFISQKQYGAVASFQNTPFINRFLNMFVSYMRYIGKMFWPSKLAVFYPPLTSDFPKIIILICVTLFILLSIICIYTGLRRKNIMTGWLWYIGTLIPMIGLIQAGAQSIANRYMYISMLGLLIILISPIKYLINNRPRLFTVLALIILPVLILLTRTQVKHWQNGITLFEYALNVTKNNYMAENCYSIALFDTGRRDEAIRHLSELVKKYPLYAEARNNLGQFLLKQGNVKESVECFEELIKQNYVSAQVYHNLGAALMMLKEYDQAILNLSKASLSDPANADIYLKLGAAYLQIGKYSPAIGNWEKAAQFQPSNAGLLNNLAWLLAAANDNSIRNGGKALEYAQRACKLTDYQNPAYLDTLAVTYASCGRFSEAIKTAESGIQIAEKSGQSEIAKKIKGRLELYKSGLPYVEK